MENQATPNSFDIRLSRLLLTIALWIVPIISLLAINSLWVWAKGIFPFYSITRTTNATMDSLKEAGAVDALNKFGSEQGIFQYNIQVTSFASNCIQSLIGIFIILYIMFKSIEAIRRQLKALPK